MAKDPREYGFEGEMAMSQLKGIIQHAEQLHDMLEPDTDLPEWVQSKITLAYDYMQTAADYMATEINEGKEFYADAKKRAAAGTPQEKLSTSWKAKARARASAAGRKYPNLVDNVWAARMQESVNEETKWIKDKHGSGYTSDDGKREIVKHPKGWISRSTTDIHDYSDVFPTQKEAKAGKYAWAMKNEEAMDNTNKNRKIAGRAGSKLSMDPDTKTPDYFTAALRRKKGLPEEAPANAVGGGKVAGMGVGAQGEPGVGKTKYKKDNIIMTDTLKRSVRKFKDFM